jgi:simple sugar transport system substrate-binding protein
MRLRYAARSLTIALVMAFVGVGCGTSTGTQGQKTGPPYTATLKYGTFKLDKRIADKLASGQKLNFKLVNYDITAAFFVPTSKGVADAATKLGVKAEMIGPTNGSSSEQAAMIESLITSGVDGLAIISADPGTLTPLINKAMDAGIPVVTTNIDAPASHRIAFYGQNLVESGQVAGREFLKYFRANHPKQAGTAYNVALFGSDPSFSYVTDRHNGFKQVVQPEGDINFVGPFATTFDNTKAYAAVETTYRAHPDLAGTYFADGLVVAGGTYIDRHQLNGKVTNVGFNFEPGTGDLMKKNAIQASIGQYPYKQGYDPMQALYNFLKNGKLPACAPSCFLGEEVSDQANVSTFDFNATSLAEWIMTAG